MRSAVERMAIQNYFCMPLSKREPKATVGNEVFECTLNNFSIRT